MFHTFVRRVSEFRILLSLIPSTHCRWSCINYVDWPPAWFCSSFKRSVVIWPRTIMKAISNKISKFLTKKILCGPRIPFRVWKLKSLWINNIWSFLPVISLPYLWNAIIFYFLMFVVIFRVVSVFCLFICAPICNTADWHFTSEFTFTFQRAVLQGNWNLSLSLLDQFFISFKLSKFKPWL